MVVGDPPLASFMQHNVVLSCFNLVVVVKDPPSTSFMQHNVVLSCLNLVVAVGDPQSLSYMQQSVVLCCVNLFVVIGDPPSTLFMQHNVVLCCFNLVVIVGDSPLLSYINDIFGFLVQFNSIVCVNDLIVFETKHAAAYCCVCAERKKEPLMIFSKFENNDLSLIAHIDIEQKRSF